jgi:hypothetical protein
MICHISYPCTLSTFEKIDIPSKIISSSNLSKVRLLDQSKKNDKSRTLALNDEVARDQKNNIV